MRRPLCSAEILAALAAVLGLAWAAAASAGPRPAPDDGPRPVLPPEQIPDLPSNPLLPLLMRARPDAAAASPRPSPAASRPAPDGPDPPGGQDPDNTTPVAPAGETALPPPQGEASEPPASDAAPGPAQEPAAGPEAAAAAEPDARSPRPDALAPAEEAGGMALQLAVAVNGRDTTMIAEFQELPDGGLAATAGELREVGISPPGDPPGTRLVRLADLAGLTYTYDAPGQHVAIVVPVDLLAPFTGAERGPSSYATGRSDWGAVVDYLAYGVADATRATLRPDTASATLSLDARAFSPWGLLRQTGFAGRTLGSQSRVVRQDTSYTYQDPGIPFSATLGDFVTPGPAWARPVRLAGMQGGRDYDLRPDIVTTALPVLSGTAAVPTTVDVFVNGLKTFSQEVPAGPYAIGNVPGLSGSGVAEVVTRDVTGREVRTPFPFYTAPALLQRGVVEYSAQAGYPRYGYGSEPFAYGARPAGSGAIRAGITDGLTLQAYGEAGHGLRSAGAGVSVSVLDRAVLSAAVQTSRFGGRSGFLPYLAFQTRIGPLFLSGSSQRRFGAYEDLASILSRPLAPKGPFGLWDWDASAAPAGGATLFRVPRALDQANASIEGPVGGSRVSLGYVHVDRGGSRPSHVLTAGYSQSLGRNVSFYASAWRDLAGERGTGVTFGLSAFLDDWSATTGATWEGGRFSAGASAAKLVREEEGAWGLRLRGNEARDARSGAAGAAYVGRYARVEAGLDAYGNRRTAQGEISGSLAMVGTSLAAGRRTNGAFAMVRGGAAGIPVTLGNRPVGTTDFTGNLIVPGLVPGFANRIGIDVTGMPAGIVAARTEETASPLPGSALLVDFAAAPMAAGAIVTFVDAEGLAIPAGSDGLAGSLAFVVGYDGQAYITGLSARNEATITLPDGRACTASFAYEPPSDGTNALVGPVACTGTARTALQGQLE